MNQWHRNKYGFYDLMDDPSVSYPEEGNNRYFQLEDQSPWFNQRNDLIGHFLEKYAVNGDFLDIGGGNGFQARFIGNSKFRGKVILCEPGPAGCINALKRGVDPVYRGTFQSFPFSQYAVKNCGLFDVLEHVEKDIDFLLELYHKIDTGSRVFINVPAYSWLWSQSDESSGHYRRYNVADIQRIIAATPFKLLDYSYFFNQLLLPLFLFRALPYRLGFRWKPSALEQREQNNPIHHSVTIKRIMNAWHNSTMGQLKKNKKISCGTSLFFVLEK